jgi:hypothetical protein
MQNTQSLPSTIFDHRMWIIEAADGTWRLAEISLGECILVFTSLDSLHGFLDGCEDRDDAGLHPVVFSRNRKEFGKRAREAVRQGIVGALFDPAPITGEAPFLQFSRKSQ